jgi:hypothetical protein
VRGVDVFHGVLVFLGGGGRLVFLFVDPVFGLIVVLLDLHEHSVVVV